VPFVLAAKVRGRMVITAANQLAAAQGIGIGMVVADARALLPGLQVLDEKPGLNEKLLKAIAEWCIRYTPFTAVDAADGLILNISGCAHLWQGEQVYLKTILSKLKEKGYSVRAAIADTIGCAWGIARFGKEKAIIEPQGQLDALLSLPPAALRLEPPVLDKLQKLGLYTIKSFISMPRPALRKRFGQHTLLRIDQALGVQEELIEPVQTIEPYTERLPCLEPIATAAGIEIALQRLLGMLCQRLQKEGKGVRTAHFKCYRIDGRLEQISIGTNRATRNTNHLFKLFELNIHTIEPALGIELFVLEAPIVEEVIIVQESMWATATGLENNNVVELIDRINGKLGNIVHRYLPDEHYWPERSFKEGVSLQEKPATVWKAGRPRPINLLTNPDPVEVAAPIPDYPPMHFSYKGELHKIKNADGPERIEREWWMDAGQHRDYYYVEDTEGNRYWLFRLGHYEDDKKHRWFIHGFFA
jgi:protein ImuB